ncbi:MAG: endonuclease/exonuclease/phosphatase family protein [Haloarculaceae archaeon]
MDSLRVMSFNVRTNMLADGSDAWPHRRHLVASTIRFHAPDVVGVQEADPFQLRELEAMLPEYEWVGDPRQDGDQRGEHVPVGYRIDGLALVETDTFWLSETPAEAGSVGWDGSHPRVATWARLRDRASGREFVHLNTHLDHEGERARREGAALLVERLGAVVDGEPAVVTGDFNCTADERPYEIVAGSRLADGRRLRDTRETASEGHHGPTTTRTDFHDLVPDETIDHVFATDDLQVRRHAACTDRGDERYPSDHLPLVVDVEFERDPTDIAIE